MNSTTTEAPVRGTFIRMCRAEYVKGLVKEAKRVKYTITRDADWWVEVTDPDHDNSLVFKAVQMQPRIWGVTFSKVYWQEPTP